MQAGYSEELLIISTKNKYSGNSKMAQYVKALDSQALVQYFGNIHLLQGLYMYNVTCTCPESYITFSYTVLI